MNKHSAVRNIAWAYENGQPNWYSKVAKEVADELGIENNPITRGHNDERDALRHTYIISLIAYRYPEVIAEKGGSWNEAKHGDNNPVGEEWMDNYNNVKGIEIARSVKASGGNEEDLKAAVYKAMQDGEVVLTPFDPRRTFEEHGDFERAKRESAQLMKDEVQRELVRIGNSDKTPSEKQRARERINQKYKEYERQRQKAVDKIEASDKTAANQNGGGGDVNVKGYSRETGSVKSHTRTRPDGDPSNNKSR